MADRFWSGGIGLPSKAVSLQAARPILVARRAASSVRLGRSQTQSSLGSTLELGLIKNSIKMRPVVSSVKYAARVSQTVRDYYAIQVRWFPEWHPGGVQFSERGLSARPARCGL